MTDAIDDGGADAAFASNMIWCFVISPREPNNPQTTNHKPQNTKHKPTNKREPRRGIVIGEEEGGRKEGNREVRNYSRALEP